VPLRLAVPLFSVKTALFDRIGTNGSHDGYRSNAAFSPKHGRAIPKFSREELLQDTSFQEKNFEKE
jgi:hypothetical protein